MRYLPGFRLRGLRGYIETAIKEARAEGMRSLWSEVARQPMS